MPQNLKQQEKKSAQPSPGFLERMFGSEKFSPEQEEGIKLARKEMPNMAPVQPYGFFSRLLQPNALAYVSGGSNIYLNPAGNEGQTPQSIADTLTHEQQHVQQKSAYGPTMNFLNSLLSRKMPYHQDPDEMAAFQAEKDRRTLMGREQTPVPSFTSGNFYTPTDIRLPVENFQPTRRSYEPSNFQPIRQPIDQSKFKRLPNVQSGYQPVTMR